ncbi:CidA/LrgA family protein [Neisseria leonii]|uniref:CidA/LrgA family protein n=1 Tax=Neisseria leonii TaxID=2995413 RepID=A0A9X4E4G8_9NEIS|nr:MULTISPECIES: CidA/LrgA family protein [unclassified Neisseria]MDD9326280.1 CidA/LrgA family protein [Neisseria sp. 3986]MDD9328590.1 CidA/LrgA family protein [Neisseria sp. 51.81]
MVLIRALCIIFGFLAAGEGVVLFSGVPLPGSIVGLGLLFAALQAGWVQASWLSGLTDLLMANLSLFLVPPCVAVMNYLDLIASDLWSIVSATVLSTVAVLLVTGKVHEWLRKGKGGRAES